MYLGIDFGTSGCRATLINSRHDVIAEARVELRAPLDTNGRIQQQALSWLEGLEALLKMLSKKFDLKHITRLSIDGTSGTVLLCNDQGQTLCPALMYNDSSSKAQVDVLKQACPDSGHLTLSPSSGLAKALQLSQQIDTPEFYILNQADFLSNTLLQRWGLSDYHNALKLGYDVKKLCWPQWIQSLFPQQSLPEVFEPGQVMGQIHEQQANHYGFSAELVICAGTTDANAAFMASGCRHAGDAVTSLGSTLVLKMLSAKPIQQLDSGIYSHKLGHLWLAGGASNTGAGILRNYFNDDELNQLSQSINPGQPSGLDYYPLTTIGERFPTHDPLKQPILSPRPASDVKFLQGIFEGLARIEAQGYDKLVELGATPLQQVLTCGGGAKNAAWNNIRHRLLGVPVERAQQDEASYGSALLACHGLEHFK